MRTRIAALMIFSMAVALVVRAILSTDHQRYDDNQISFDDFNNETGVNHFIVPNIIHQVRFNQTQFTFVDYVCLLAAFRNQRPDYFYIHTDVPNGRFEGKYWEWVQNDRQLSSRIRIVHREAPKEIFGQKLDLKEYGLWHGSDYTRVHLLTEHGGIYLDNDMYVVQSLDKYRKFEATVNWDEGLSLGNQIIIANKNARILPLWLSTYQDYRSDLWYYNGGLLPTKAILHKYPELIHRVRGKFGIQPYICIKLYTEHDFDWRRLDTIHLLIGYREDLDPGYHDTPVFNEKIIQNYSFPFGEMVRELIDASGFRKFDV